MVDRNTYSWVLAPIGLLALWQVSSAVLRYEYLPGPRDVLAAFVDLVQTGELMRDVMHTLGVTLIAAAIALTFGAALGLALGLIPTLRIFLMASIDFLRTIPAVALVPVAVLTFGPSVTTECMLVVYASLWPVVVATAAGAAAVHPRQYDIARMLRFSRATTVRKIVIPAAVPAWLVGGRLAAVIALLVAIVAEMVMYPRGLGGGLLESLNALAPARMWAYALVCGLIGFALNAALRQLVRLVLPGSPVNPDRVVAISVQPATTQPPSPLPGLLPLVGVLVVWQLVTTSDSLSFPPPTEWWAALSELQRDGVLLGAIAQSVSTYLLGLALATVIGAGGGIAIGVSRRVDKALTPTVDFLAAIPGAALVPVVVLLLGPTQLSGVVVVALVVAWPILLSTAMAMRTIPAVRLEMSRTLGLTPVQRWRKVIMPSLTPGIMLGVRVGSAMALIVTLLVDILGIGAGIGRLLVESQQRFEGAAAWGLLVVVGVFGYLMSALFATAGRNAAPAGPRHRLADRAVRSG